MPSVSRLLEHPDLRQLRETVPASLITDAVRSTLEEVRKRLLDPATDPQEKEVVELTPDSLAKSASEEALRRHLPTLQGAINATGVVLHTGLGRARLAEAARDALVEVASGHAMVEIDRATGQRGSRRDHVRGLLCDLTGAEDATVVNNCAGAVFLAVTALAAGREVILSRGELVEIGGAFRMPDIIRASGATLVEVGTTNRTRISDYRNAISERTGLILRCHPSNFALVGFTESTPTEDLAALGRERSIPVMDDQGSGALLPIESLFVASVTGVSSDADAGYAGSSAQTGTGWKGSLRDSVRAGADLITASGDKLLGGPQAGIVLGKKELVERIARHPLARALRVDKFTLAALEATLRLYRDPKQARLQIPTLRYLARTEPELRRMAQRLRNRLRAVLDSDLFELDLIPERSQVGGGSLPGENLPTVCVRLRLRTTHKGSEEGSEGEKRPDIRNIDAMARALRMHRPAIFARIRSDALLFDPRTLEPKEIDTIADSIRTLWGRENQKSGA